jgi:LysM repeat protein
LLLNFAKSQRVSFCSWIERNDSLCATRAEILIFSLRYNPAMHRRRFGLAVLWIFGLTFALLGCKPKSGTTTAVPTEPLISWQTPTPRGTLDLTQSALQPSVTPTPRVHEVVSGEVLGYIAGRYGVTVDQIVKANPGLNPDFLTIGQKITIPNPVPGSNQVIAGSGQPAPTPVEVDLGGVNCYHSLEGGAWCFIPVHNTQENMVENVSADIRLYDPAGQQVAGQVAFTILDIIPAGATLPVAAYFEAPIPYPVTARAEVSSGILVPPGDTRYLAAGIKDQLITIQANGLSAVVTGEVAFDYVAKGASSTWVAAVAYDASNAIVGVRRWMSKTAVPEGQTQPFSLLVYSSHDAIVRVELAVEARP